MALTIKKYEAATKFQFGEGIGIKSALDAGSRLRYKYYTPTVVKFGMGDDKAYVYPDGTGAGVLVEIVCDSDEPLVHSATPDIKFALKYDSFTAVDASDGAATSVCYVLDILTDRKSIADALKNIHAVSA